MTAGRFAVAAGFGYLAWRLWNTAADEDFNLFTDIDSTIGTLGNIMTTFDLPGPARDPKTGEDYTPLILKHARLNGVPPVLLWALIKQESGFNKAARSSVGAAGLTQFMPATAREWGVDVNDPESSISGGARYIAWLYRRHGTWRLAVAAYNWGTGNVARKGLAAMPAETRNYVRVVYDNYASELPA